MAEIVVMPKLGLLMETGAVSTWTASEGDEVAIGDVIAEITTEKITYELEAQSEGTLLKILLGEDEEAPVGHPIAVIGQPGEDISALGIAATGGGEAPQRSPEEETSGRVAAATAVPPPAAAGVPSPVHAPGERIVASPAAKKLAGELDVDLAYVAGSGPGGRITIADVESAHAQGVPAAGVAGPGDQAAESATAETVAGGAFATPTAKKMAAELGVDLSGVAGGGPSGRIRAEDVARDAAAVTSVTTGPPPAEADAAADLRGGILERIPYAGMRRMIGEHMDQSRSLAPTVTYSGRADVQKLKELIAQINAKRPDDDRVNITAATILAAALTLEKMPQVNSTLDGDVIKLWRHINVGVAVALDDGLIVPVVRQANRKRLTEIAREVKDLAGKARENRLLPDDISGGTFTVSTLGSYRSVDYFSPIINQPESAILGVGRMQDSIVAVGGDPVVHATMGLSLTCDHRVIDGAPAAEFLKILMDLLEEPLGLLV